MHLKYASSPRVVCLIQVFPTSVCMHARTHKSVVVFIDMLAHFLTRSMHTNYDIFMQIDRLPPEVVKYFTDPDAIEPPDLQLLYPFVDSALPLAYGLLGIQILHVRNTLPYFFLHISVFLTSKENIWPNRAVF